MEWNDIFGVLLQHLDSCPCNHLSVVCTEMLWGDDDTESMMVRNFLYHFQNKLIRRNSSRHHQRLWETFEEDFHRVEGQSDIDFST